MKLLRLAIIVIIVCGSGFGLFFCVRTSSAPATVVQQRHTAGPKAPGAIKNVFSTGEKISFGVYSNIIKVGSGSLTYVGTIQGVQGVWQHVKLQVETLSVSDTDEVYGSLDFTLPHKVDRRLRLFGRDEAIGEIYAPGNKSVTISKSTNGKAEPPETITSDNALENVLLLIYRLRNDPGLAVGKSYTVNLPTQKFVLTVKSRMPLKVPLGKFQVFYIESNPSKYKIWITDDQRRLPVRIQGLVSFGMVYMAATAIETP
jgi:hypothetical protein